MKKQCGGPRGEGRALPAPANTKSSCILARTSSHVTLHQRRRRRRRRKQKEDWVKGGTIGTAQRSLVTTIDRRTPNGHYGNGVHGLRSHALSWLPEPRCVSRRAKQQIATNEQTGKVTVFSHLVY